MLLVGGCSHLWHTYLPQHLCGHSNSNSQRKAAQFCSHMILPHPVLLNMPLIVYRLTPGYTSSQFPPPKVYQSNICTEICLGTMMLSSPFPGISLIAVLIFLGTQLVDVTKVVIDDSNTTQITYSTGWKEFNNLVMPTMENAYNGTFHSCV